MKNIDATEQAYNNGYEAGKKEMAKSILQELYDEAIQYDRETLGIEWKAKEYGIDLKEQ